LIAGQTIERELAGSETHTYRIEARGGEFVGLIVEPRGIEVMLKLTSAEGRQVAHVQSAAEGVRGRPISFIATTTRAATTGAYQLSVSAFGQALRGSYQIKVTEWRSATLADESRVAAERAIEDAERLDNLRRAETTRQAVAKFEEALALWRAAGDRSREADTLESLSEIWRRLGEYQKSFDALDLALQIRIATGDRNGEASVLNGIGQTWVEIAEYQKALEHYERALGLKTGIRSLEADLLNNSGAVYRRVGDLRKAQDHYRRAVAMSREVGNRRLQATLLNNLAVASDLLGDYQLSLDSLAQALTLWRALGDLEGEGMSLNNAGSVYSNLGDIQQALESYTHALQLRRTAGSRPGEAVALGNIGTAYRKLGNREKALENMNQSLELRRAINDRMGEAGALNGIGLVYLFDKNYAQALDYFNQSVELNRSIRRTEAAPLENVAHTLYLTGDYLNAREHFSQVLQQRREGGIRNGEAQALLGLARAEQKLGNLSEALSHMEAAIAIIEGIRTGIVSPDLRVAYHATNQDFYEHYIDLLMQLDGRSPSEGFAARALQASERARSRSLLDLLIETQADLRQGVEPRLLDEERRLITQINGRETRRRQLLGPGRDQAAISAVDKELNELLAKYRELQARIRIESPRYAALTQPQTLSLREIQTRVVDSESLLLEYTLGRDRSYLWVVTPESFRTFVLPSRAEIEKAARRLNDSLVALRDQFTDTNMPRRGSAGAARSKTDFKAASMELSQMLLGQVVDLLDKKRLVVVSDGVLQYVPFAALPRPAAALRQSAGGRDQPGVSAPATTGARRESISKPQPASAHQRPLILDHEIVNLPSASVLAVLRQERGAGGKVEPSLAIFADPVFSADDPRLASAGDVSRRKADTSEVAGARYGSLQRSARDAGINGFSRLRFSREEALGIAGLFTMNRAMTALDFKASRATATSPDLVRYRILHFATHGLLNTQRPELSGLVLSLVDERGQPQDGFLRLHEVYSLKLNAELVVMSGCETALGKDMRGEGLIGLTRGFMYAGTDRVVASLWRVDDRATADLMKRFYQGMLKGRSTPAAALRAAQVSMLTDPRWSAPHYWAAFTIQGEWR
jgi:CHAT domain-containing protein/tetratricopeptide (TPR) repeat protein